MTSRPRVELFGEDAGHEAFVRALLTRLANEAAVPRPDVVARSARGGHGRAVHELELWQRTLRRGGLSPDLLVVAIDANGEGWTNQRRSIEALVDRALFGEVVIACPDPHVEAWIAADEGAFRRAFGVPAAPPPTKVGRDGYKAWLQRALDEAEVPVLTDPMSISAEVVDHIDLYAAGKASPSLRACTADLAGFFKRFRDRA